MSKPESHATSMNEFRWKNRPLLIFAPTPEDDRYRAQLEMLQRYSPEIEDREITLLHVFERYGNRDDEAQQLRDRYGVQNGEFLVVLVGKDGGKKLEFSEPVEPVEVFNLIDAMPMRRKEMEHRRPE